MDAVVTIGVLTASNNDVKLTCRNANCTFSQGVLQVTEMIKDFFEFKSFDSGIFLGRKIWQVFFGWLDFSRDFFRYSKQSEDSW